MLRCCAVLACVRLCASFMSLFNTIPPKEMQQPASPLAHTFSLLASCALLCCIPSRTHATAACRVASVRGFRMTFLDRLTPHGYHAGAGFASRHSGTSGFRGVSWHTQTRRWKSQIKVGGKDINLGRHQKEAAAAQVGPGSTDILSCGSHIVRGPCRRHPCAVMSA